MENLARTGLQAPPAGSTRGLHTHVTVKQPCSTTGKQMQASEKGDRILPTAHGHHSRAVTRLGSVSLYYQGPSAPDLLTSAPGRECFCILHRAHATPNYTTF